MNTLSKVSFIKMSGTSNDFIIIDSRKNNYTFNKDQISKISKRNNIGCDQFILLKESIKADIFMDIYNSDGSSSAACGNATRCVASLLMKELSKNQLLIETRAGILPCYQDKDCIVVNMGKPRFYWKEIPLSHDAKEIVIDGMKFYALSMGNPHIVTFLASELSDKDFFELGPKLENNQLFPQKTNVEFVTKISSGHFKVRVWERGAGETLACGSGACAVGATILLNDISKDKEIRVSFKGGDIFISLNKEGEVMMRGNAQTIFYGIIDEEFLQ